MTKENSKILISGAGGEEPPVQTECVKCGPIFCSCDFDVASTPNASFGNDLPSRVSSSLR